MQRGTVSRRRFLVATGASLAGAPFINTGRYCVFAAGVHEYSAHAIRLVNDSLVMDMLSLFDLRRVLAAIRGG